MRDRFLIAKVSVAVALLAVLAGCKPAGSTYDATVQGSVTIDGELAQSGTVTFNPVKDGPVATGRVFKDGTYSVRTGQGDLSDPDRGTIRSGEYIITVSVTGPPQKSTEEGAPPSAGPRLMADKYATKDSSDLKFTVAAGPNVINLKLDGPTANPPMESEPGSEGDKTPTKDDGASKGVDPTGDSPVASVQGGESSESGAPAATAGAEGREGSTPGAEGGK